MSPKYLQWFLWFFLFLDLQQVEINKSQLCLAMANHDIPPDAVRDKKLCRLPPLDTSTLVGVFVEYIISPSQFYIRIYSRDSSELLEDMMIEMRQESIVFNVFIYFILNQFSNILVSGLLKIKAQESFCLLIFIVQRLKLQELKNTIKIIVNCLSEYR